MTARPTTVAEATRERVRTPEMLARLVRPWRGRGAPGWVKRARAKRVPIARRALAGKRVLRETSVEQASAAPAEMLVLAVAR